MRRARKWTTWALMVTISASLMLEVQINSSGASSPSDLPTLSQLEKYIDASTKIATSPKISSLIPSTLTPINADATINPMPYACYGSWPPSESQPISSNVSSTCDWGDRTAARSIFLIGDSQAAMWLPAFNAFGAANGWRIYFLAKASCAPWITDSARVNTGIGTYSNSACKSFIKNEIDYVNAIRPTVVIPVGLGAAGPNSYDSFSEQKAAVTKTLTALKPSGAKILLLAGFSWAFGITPEECFTIHATNLSSCEVKPKTVEDLTLNTGLRAAANSDH